MSRELLLGQLDFLHRNLGHYLQAVPADRFEWRPAPDFFTLRDLAAHLCGLPAKQHAILTGVTGPALDALDVPAAASLSDLRRLLDDGMAAISAYYRDLTPAAYSTSTIQNPYAGPMTPEQMLLDLVTHLFHHRGQLHNYLRALGAGVDTGTLYEG
jgi:uncharacterized damage-inducible protein DinB